MGFFDTFFESLNYILTSGEIFSILLLSFQISIIATFFASCVGIPLGILLASSQFKGQGLLFTIFNTLVGFPPVVMGVFLYILFVSAGPFGFLSLLFTKQIMILAQFLLALPIIIVITSNGYQSLNPSLLETIRILKCSPLRSGKILLREMHIFLFSAVTLAFGRAIGEVGAIIIVGGNIRWETRTLTTAIVLETSQGRLSFALALGIVLLFFSFSLNFFAQQFSNNSEKSRIARSILKITGVLGSFISFTLYSLGVFLRLIPSSPSSSPNFFENQHLSYSDILNNYYNLIENSLNPPSSIDLKEVSLTLDKKPILNNLSFVCNPGKITVILGANGAGKTSLLRCLSGLIPISGGKMSIISSPNENMKIEPESLTQTSTQQSIHLDHNTTYPFLHQHPVILQGSVLDNIFVGISRNDDNRLLKEMFALHLISKFDLSTEGMASSMSIGQQSKISFLRLLFSNSRLLFFDEPTASWDRQSIFLFEELLQKLSKLGFTVVISTHDFLHAQRIADTVILLDKGTVQYSGKALSVTLESDSFAEDEQNPLAEYFNWKKEEHN